jgi:sortase (surface protein transpeptidase)
MTAVTVPVRLQIPVLGVSAAIVSVGVAADAGLGIPADPSVVGWWAGGGSPGQPSGATVLTGHIDSAVSGPGALFRLQDVRPGAMVIVTAGGHTYRYVVQAIRAYSKTRLPAATIFDQQVTPRLVIVTCGGPFDADTGHYLDNIVAYALPARPDPSP